MSLRLLDDFLPAYEFWERHRIAIDAPAGRIDAASREVSIADIPLARALWWVRRLGRAYGDAAKPFIGGELPGVVLEDVADEGIVLGLTGQFWRLLGGQRDAARPTTPEEFLAYDRPDTCKAVIDFRVGERSLSTETRVHVADPASRRKFRRYWFIVRPFSGLIRMLLLRAARRRAEAAA
ncbi:MAG TPA: hypothetical protein VMK83_00285 [Gaiellaceae bacterium]|nr:hypothetical protein [Gaiellaceae bacterium]